MQRRPHAGWFQGFARLGLPLRGRAFFGLNFLCEYDVFATADITPVLYFGFLASSLTFACVTYVALSKIKLI